MAPAEFWRMTPRQLDVALTVRREEDRVLEEMRQRFADHRAGIIAATIDNLLRGKGSKARQPSDYFASLKPPAGTEPGGESTAEIKAKWQMFVAIYNANQKKIKA